MSLYRLRQDRRKPDEPRQLPADIYGWFAEGFDTVDLQEARALLAEPARAGRESGAHLLRHTPR
jgi:hypothetical protein